MIDVEDAKRLLDDLEASPDRVQLYSETVRQLITDCMNEVFGLSKTGENDRRKMAVVAIEHRARLIIERWKSANRN